MIQAGGQASDNIIPIIFRLSQICRFSLSAQIFILPTRDTAQPDQSHSFLQLGGRALPVADSNYHHIT